MQHCRVFRALPPDRQDKVPSPAATSPAPLAKDPSLFSKQAQPSPCPDACRFAGLFTAGWKKPRPPFKTVSDPGAFNADPPWEHGSPALGLRSPHPCTKEKPFPGDRYRSARASRTTQGCFLQHLPRFTPSQGHGVCSIWQLSPRPGHVPAGRWERKAGLKNDQAGQTGTKQGHRRQRARLNA